MAPDGSVFIADTGNSRVRRWAGRRHYDDRWRHFNGAEYGDGGPATLAQLNIRTVSGSLYISDAYQNRVRQITADGIITVAGSTFLPGFSGDSGSAKSRQAIATESRRCGGRNPLHRGPWQRADSRRNAGRRHQCHSGQQERHWALFWRRRAGHRGRLRFVHGLALTSDGTLLVTDYMSDRVLRIAPSVHGFSLALTSLVPSESGAELYVFNSRGRHMSTKDTRFGFSTYSFDYGDPNKVPRPLLSVTDRDGRITRDRARRFRDADKIVAPFGPGDAARAGRRPDSNDAGQLHEPGNETTSFTYDGLLQDLTDDPRNHVSKHQYDALGRVTLDRTPRRSLPARAWG